MSYQPTTPYYSRDSEIFHNCKNCTRGDKIESDKLEKGNSGKRHLCQRCKDIRAGKVTR